MYLNLNLWFDWLGRYYNDLRVLTNFSVINVMLFEITNINRVSVSVSKRISVNAYEAPD